MIKAMRNAAWKLLSGLIILAGCLWLAGTGPGWKVNGLFLDTAAEYLGSSRPAPAFAVILITEKNYEAKATPFALWGKHLTPLMARLRQDKPKAVGLDLILPRFSLAQFAREIDRGFFRELKQLSRVSRLVSGYGINAAGKAKEPFIFYQRILGAKGYGYFNLSPDPDKINRTLILEKRGTKGEKLYAFSALLAGGPPAPEAITPDWRNPARFTTYSFDQALKAPQNAFTDKIVLVGVQLDFQDRHLTPAALSGEPGVLFQARIAEALISGNRLYDPGWMISSLAPAALALLALLLAAWRAPVARTVITGCGIALGVCLLCIASLYGGMILRPLTGAAGVLAATAVLVLQGYAKVRESFGRYVSRRVRDEILSGRIPLDGQTKEVTVLFADLRGFTPLTASFPPKQVVAMINRYFHEMSTAIQSQGGLVLQYVGDEIYAVFGAPLPSDDQATHALNAAFEMCKRLMP